PCVLPVKLGTLCIVQSSVFLAPAWSNLYSRHHVGTVPDAESPKLTDSGRSQWEKGESCVVYVLGNYVYWLTNLKGLNLWWSHHTAVPVLETPRVFPYPWQTL